MSLTEMQPRRTAHTLFMDFVGYSRLSAEAQAAVQVALQNLVYNLPAFQAARTEGELMVRKTGDGMAVIFFKDVEYPLAAAVALDEAMKRQSMALREQIGANFRLRMGLHSGPVVLIDEDGDGVMDVAGEGINTAQRVMDCCDEGHILASASVVNLLEDRPHWKPMLHDLGVVRVKHDELVHLYNVYSTRPDGTTIGYEAMPRWVRESHENARRLAERDAVLEKVEERSFVMGYALRASLLIGAVVVLGGLLWSFWHTRATLDIKRVATAARELRIAKELKTKKTASSPTVVTVATPSAGNLVDIPNLVGMPREDAEKALAAVGLKLALSEENPTASNPTIPAGAVVSQQPLAGKQKPGAPQVFVTLSSGPDAPRNGGEASAFTGVLIDARTFPQLANAHAAALYGPDNSALYAASGVTNDQIEAVQAVGVNPLRITATMANSAGVALAAEDVQKLRALTDAVRAKTVVLRP